MADATLQQGVKGISEVIVVPGLINLDFADVRAVMADAGTAMMGIGESSGEDRASEAANAAVSSPLMETNIEGASAVMLNVTGGPDMTLSQVHEASQIIQGAASGEDGVDLTLGAVIDESMEGQIRVTVLATGFVTEYKAEAPAAAAPAVVAQPAPQAAERPAVLPSVPVTPPAATPFDQETPTYDEDDVDIPAFLRRKD